MKIQTAPTQFFSEHAPSFNYRISMDTKGPINPPSHNKSNIHVIFALLVTLLLQYPSNQTTQRLLSKLFYTIGFLNLDHPYILSLIVDQNMLIKKWHTFVHLWEFVILLEQLTLLGQMTLSKYKTEILVHIYECSYMTHLKIGHSKSICTLMHIIHNHFQNSVFPPIKMFFTPDPEYPLCLI